MKELSNIYLMEFLPNFQICHQKLHQLKVELDSHLEEEKWESINSELSSNILNLLSSEMYCEQIQLQLLPFYSKLVKLILSFIKY